jgi:hypothetical protein
MIYSRDQLDNNFRELLENKVKRLRELYTPEYEKRIRLDELKRIGIFFDDLKPKSQQREYKRLILDYLDELKNTEKELTKKEIWDLINKYLSPVFNYLNDKHDFLLKGTWFYIGIYGFILDVILYFVGIGKHYYYLPVFAIIFLLSRYIKERKAKKKGKFIDF